MTDPGVMMTGLGGGLFIGLFFFLSLYWSTKRVLVVRRPLMFFMLSLILRSGLALAGFYLVAWGSWQRLIWASLGFFVARIIVVNLLDHFEDQYAGEV